MSERKANVTVIPASISTMAGIPLNSSAKRRVAAYARVSTDSAEQETYPSRSKANYGNQKSGKQLNHAHSFLRKPSGVIFNIG